MEAEIETPAGMEKMELNSALNYLDFLGYKLKPENCFNYFNGSNDTKYPARSIYLVEKDTGLSAFHIDARRDENFKKLQTFRRSVFVSAKGRVWEF